VTNLEKYQSAFAEAFEIVNEDCVGLQYQGIPQWDSVGHMNLIAIIEDNFGIAMDADDIIDLSSFEKGKQLLAEKYDVEF
jgi:hypothetical protein